jgi:hypothetical protein
LPASPKSLPPGLARQNEPISSHPIKRRQCRRSKWLAVDERRTPGPPLPRFNRPRGSPVHVFGGNPSPSKGAEFIAYRGYKRRGCLKNRRLSICGRRRGAGTNQSQGAVAALPVSATGLIAGGLVVQSYSLPSGAHRSPHEHGAESRQSSGGELIASIAGTTTPTVRGRQTQRTLPHFRQILIIKKFLCETG